MTSEGFLNIKTLIYSGFNAELYREYRIELLLC